MEAGDRLEEAALALRREEEDSRHLRAQLDEANVSDRVKGAGGWGGRGGGSSGLHRIRRPLTLTLGLSGIDTPGGASRRSGCLSHG